MVLPFPGPLKVCSRFVQGGVRLSCIDLPKLWWGSPSEVFPFKILVCHKCGPDSSECISVRTISIAGCKWLKQVILLRTTFCSIFGPEAVYPVKNEARYIALKFATEQQVGNRVACSRKTGRFNGARSINRDHCGRREVWVPCRMRVARVRIPRIPRQGEPIQIPSY